MKTRPRSAPSAAERASSTRSPGPPAAPARSQPSVRPAGVNHGQRGVVGVVQTSYPFEKLLDDRIDRLGMSDRGHVAEIIELHNLDAWQCGR